MATLDTQKTDTANEESFATLLDESLGKDVKFEGAILTGTIVKIDNEMVHVDVGLKAEGAIPLREVTHGKDAIEVKVGDQIDVFLDRIENSKGEIVLSRDKARREESWMDLEKLHEKQERVEGIIFGRVKGGFTVDLAGVVAFLPGSQVDIRPIKNITPLMNAPQPFQILKMDRERGNIVVSRRAVLEESRAEARGELISNLHEGQVLDGIVKNVTDYGAFVDLGGIDGLLHVTDISWSRIGHPSEVLALGDTVKVKIIKFDQEAQRISLGIKQLQDDPWKAASSKYDIGSKYTGRVSNITDYGAFVTLEAGVEGLIHHSELSWVRKNVHPGKIVSVSEEVEIMVLDIDSEKRRISLGLKQCTENPWKGFEDKHAVGDILEGEVKNIAEFGLFVAVGDELEGMIHASDIDWAKSDQVAIKDYKKGDQVKCKILSIDIEKERVALGIKQLTENPFGKAAEGIDQGKIVTCTVTATNAGGIEVKIGDDNTSISGFIRKADLSKERQDQRTDRFAIGEKIDAKVTFFDQANEKLGLSIKAREIDEEKHAMKEYGSSDSGATLGDILGVALKKEDK